MKSKQVRIEMDETIWTMLDRMFLVVSARAKKRGLPRVQQRRLVGAILSYFFLRHSDEVLSEESDVTLRTTQEHLRKVFTDDELAAIGLAELSSVRRDRQPAHPRGSRRGRSDK